MSATRRRTHETNLRIGEVLMERNYITQEQMEQALAYQKEHREKRVGQILIELGFVTETQVIERWLPVWDWKL